MKKPLQKRPPALLSEQALAHETHELYHQLRKDHSLPLRYVEMEVEMNGHAAAALKAYESGDWKKATHEWCMAIFRLGCAV